MSNASWWDDYVARVRAAGGGVAEDLDWLERNSGVGVRDLGVGSRFGVLVAGDLGSFDAFDARAGGGGGFGGGVGPAWWEKNPADRSLVDNFAAGAATAANLWRWGLQSVPGMRFVPAAQEGPERGFAGVGVPEWDAQSGLPDLGVFQGWSGPAGVRDERGFVRPGAFVEGLPQDIRDWRRVPGEWERIPFDPSLLMRDVVEDDLGLEGWRAVGAEWGLQLLEPGPSEFAALPWLRLTRRAQPLVADVIENAASAVSIPRASDGALAWRTVENSAREKAFTDAVYELENLTSNVNASGTGGVRWRSFGAGSFEVTDPSGTVITFRLTSSGPSNERVVYIAGLENPNGAPGAGAASVNAVLDLADATGLPVITMPSAFTPAGAGERFNQGTPLTTDQLRHMYNKLGFVFDTPSYMRRNPVAYDKAAREAELAARYDAGIERAARESVEIRNATRANQPVATLASRSDLINWGLSIGVDGTNLVNAINGLDTDEVNFLIRSLQDPGGIPRDQMDYYLSRTIGLNARDANQILGAVYPRSNPASPVAQVTSQIVRDFNRGVPLDYISADEESILTTIGADPGFVNTMRRVTRTDPDFIDPQIAGPYLRWLVDEDAMNTNVGARFLESNANSVSNLRTALNAGETNAPVKFQDWLYQMEDQIYDGWSSGRFSPDGSSRTLMPPQLRESAGDAMANIVNSGYLSDSLGRIATETGYGVTARDMFPAFRSDDLGGTRTVDRIYASNAIAGDAVIDVFSGATGVPEGELAYAFYEMAGAPWAGANDNLRANIEDIISSRSAAWARDYDGINQTTAEDSLRVIADYLMEKRGWPPFSWGFSADRYR